MLSFSHTLGSLWIGSLLPNPWLAFVAGFLWHLVCDWLLHWNIYPDQFKRYPYEWVALDILAGLASAALFLGTDVFNLAILAAIAGANMPDIIHGVWSFLPDTYKDTSLSWAKPWFSFHEWIQHETTNVPLGLVSQLVVIAFSLFLSKKI